MKNRQSDVSMASLYHRCEKYSEMINIAKNLIKEDPNLTDLEMSVFIEGYKCKLNEIRKVLIKLLEIQGKETKRGSSHVHLIEELINPKIEELSNLCDDFNAQIDFLISKPKNFDTLANLTRLKLDFLRYKCQFIKRGEEWQKAHDDFFNTINKIESIGKDFLSSNNIHMLNIQLCKCVFYYEVLNKPNEAIESGKKLLKSILSCPQSTPKPLPKKEMTEEKESKPSVIEESVESKKGDKKDDSKKSKNSEKKNSPSKSKDDKKDEKDKKTEKEIKSTESKENVVEGNKSEGEKKDENNTNGTEEKKENEKEKDIQIEKPILTPELNQFIYILRTNIILWSGKHESDIKL